MRIKSILLVSLLALLYGCQPEASAPKAAAPAAVAPAPVASAPAPAEQAAQPAIKEVATPAPASVAQTAPAPANTAPAAQAETAPVATEAKPEVKSGAVVSEADFMQLAKKGNCLACHAADKKVVGPAFKDVAAKYRGDAGAEARLADKIAKGGSGVWGAMMMPPSPKTSEADRIALAKYVLSLK